MASWPRAVKWLALTALLAYGLVFVNVLLWSGLFDGIADRIGIGDPPVGVAVVVAIIEAVLLRRYWPAIRAWNQTTDDWFSLHPVPTMAMYLSIGLWIGASPGGGLFGAAFGAAIWGFMGWLHLRQPRRPA